MLRYYFYIACFLLCTVSIQAQENFVFSPIDSNNGLSENEISCITQLRDGRMVIATDGLVNIYNGTSFSYLHHNEEHAYYLSDYIGYCRAYVGSEGYLWIKNYHKILLFDTRNETFIPNLATVLHEQGIHEALKDFFMDSESDYWLLTDRDQLIRRHGEKNSVFMENVSALSTPDDQLYDLAVIENQLFLFYKQGMMICFDMNTGKELYRENPFGSNANHPYTSTLHVVPYKQYLYQIRNGNEVSPSITNASWQTSQRSAAIVHRFNTKSRKWNKVLETESSLNTLSVDNKGNCWISTQDGFWFIDKYLMETKHIPGLRLVDGRIFRTIIHTQFNDIDGGLWVGTNNRGLLYYHPDRFRFKNFSNTHFKLPDNKELNVYGFAEREDYTWVGTNSGLYTYNHANDSQPITPELTRYPAIPEQAQCVCLWKDARQRIWVCTENGYGLYCIEGDKVRQYTFPFNRLNYLHESFNGNLYLCGNQGFGLFNPESGEYKRIDGSGSSNLGNVYQLIEYGQDRLMGLSDQGVFSYTFSTNQLDISGQSDPKHPMFRQSNHKCHCLYIDSRGLIWFGTQDGLNMWNRDEQKLYSFYTEDGLINNSIQSIHEDHLQKMWVSTTNGISRIDLTNEKGCYKCAFTNYNKYDGVINPHCTLTPLLLAVGD